MARVLLENTKRAYKNLGNTIRNARDAGLLDWDAIEDRTRKVRTHASWDNPADIINNAASSYRENPWADRLYRPEVWIEKEALLGVIEGVCDEFRAPYFALKGNNSQTLQYQAGKRFARLIDQGRIPLVLLLTDHDPKGVLDIPRDTQERLNLYAGHEVEVRRLALNLDQVRRYDLPPSFVKESDKLRGAYREQFGTDECWELDALSPEVIADLIRVELDVLINAKRWRKALSHETRNRKLLGAAAQNWTKVEKMLRGGSK